MIPPANFPTLLGMEGFYFEAADQVSPPKICQHISGVTLANFLLQGFVGAQQTWNIKKL